jgi:hypothetical protein
VPLERRLYELFMTFIGLTNSLWTLERFLTAASRMMGASRKDFTSAYLSDQMFDLRVRCRRRVGVRASSRRAVLTSECRPESRRGDSSRTIGSIGIGVSYEEHLMLTVGMVVLGLATFAAMLAFVKLCDRV